MPRTVLVAVDASDASKQALTFALTALKLQPQDKLLLASCYTRLEDYSIPEDFMDASTSFGDWERAEHEKLLNDFSQDLLRQFADIPYELLLCAGDARETLTHLATERKADLIVCGSTGKGLLKRMALGSVSNYLAHHAPCPVVIVPKGTSAPSANPPHPAPTHIKGD